MSENMQVMLRPIRIEDAKVLMELNNRKEISDFVVGNPKKVDLKQQLEWMNKLDKEINTVRRMIIYNQKTVGTIIISSIDNENSVGNMNIKVLPEYQGFGIGKKSIKLACDFAFDELNLYCLTANVLQYNAASYNLFKSVGFHKDGVLRERIIKNGKRHNLIALSLLKTERV